VANQKTQKHKRKAKKDRLSESKKQGLSELASSIRGAVQALKPDLKAAEKLVARLYTMASKESGIAFAEAADAADDVRALLVDVTKELQSAYEGLKDAIQRRRDVEKLLAQAARRKGGAKREAEAAETRDSSAAAVKSSQAESGGSAPTAEASGGAPSGEVAGDVGVGMGGVALERSEAVAALS